MTSFENLRIVDNFYQTSLFFPMPTVIISTLCEDGSTSLGPYSLIQPYYVAGRDYYAMLLCCRNSSNTAQNILANGITSQYGAHFILRVDKILMKKRYKDAIINGVRAKDFPSYP